MAACFEKEGTTSRMNDKTPSISVIIHFLNAARYLSQAIDSVLRQTFPGWELILVDGGSCDDSVEIAKRYQAERPAQIRILEHTGQTTLGIFSSRIWGAQEAHAPILALLDSDDEWHPQFLERQYAIYQRMFADRSGMVYCPVVYWWEDPTFADQSYVQPMPSPGLHEPPDLLLPFLADGYQRSAANSGVMIARDLVLDAKILIGTANEGMVEDQYLWSFLLMRMPVFVNPEPLVRYRQWGGSTCAATIKADKAKGLREIHLQWVLEYLRTSYHGQRQRELLQQVTQLLQQEYPSAARPIEPHAVLVSSISPLRQAIQRGKRAMCDMMKPRIPEKYYTQLQRAYRTCHHLFWCAPKTFLTPLRRNIHLFKTRIRFAVKVAPLSEQWGYDRGVPLHRYFLDQFLQEFAADIRGHCLEFQENSYTTKFGGERVTALDILHKDAGNSAATIVADLTTANQIPSNRFDCIICTHVLHIVSELDAFIAELYRILKPGGVLLIAVPHISMNGLEWHELWRFTPEGLLTVLAKAFGSEQITLRGYGNSLTSAGELRGVVADEFTLSELQTHDPRFASEICARVVKIERGEAADS